MSRQEAVLNDSGSGRAAGQQARSAGVLTLTMARAPVNALDDALVDALEAALEAACADDRHHGRASAQRLQACSAPAPTWR